MKYKVEYVCTTSVYRQESWTAVRENNDCVVRAFSAAFEIPYDLAHNFCAVTFKRQQGKGTAGSRPYLAKSKRLFNKEVVEMGEYFYEGAKLRSMYTRYKAPRRYWGEEPDIVRQMTVHTFLKRYRKGTFIIYITGHAFTIKDGVIYGNREDSQRLRQRVLGAFKVG